MKIRKGIPLPARRYQNERREVFPWATMEVGDSVEFECSQEEKRKTQTRIRKSATYAGKRLNRTFVSRQTESGIGIWRIK